MAFPAAGLAELWGIALAATFGAFGGLSPPDHPDLATLALSVGGGLIVVIAWRVPVKTAELAQIGAAIASFQRTAVDAAAGESSLRNGLGQVFVSLARRNQSLLQRQLRLIDALEQKAPDPAALADLFPLDHLTTRMRRHAESLIILSGAAPGRSWSQPVPVIDVIRGAVAEVEDYTRVKVVTTAGDAVAGTAAADMIHLLAELIENATLFSPSSTRAEVRAERVANGFAVEVDDRGLGIKPDQLITINEQLARPPDFDLANADRLGLFVVGRLAARHGVRVSLRPSPYGGTSAIVLMPNSLVMPSTGTQAALPAGAHAAAGSARLDLRAGPTLALTARYSSRPSLTGADFDSPSTDGSGTGYGGTGLSGTGLNGTGLNGTGLDSPGLGSAGPAGAGLGGSVLGSPGPGGGDLDRSDKPGQSAASGTYRGLPRRVRQANLSPHLRDNGPADASPPPGAPLSAPVPAPSAERSPQEARDLMSSLQSGWRRGREPDPAEEADSPIGAESPAGGGSLARGDPPRMPEVPGTPAAPATLETPDAAARRAGWQPGPEAAGSEEK